MANRLRLMIVGKGGREHALAWKLSQSPRVEHIYVVPGNGGTARGMPKVTNVPTVAATELGNLVNVAKDLRIGLVVVGPGCAVVGGIEKYFRDARIPCFAPSKEAAELEGSKKSAKDFMQKFNIPTAAFTALTTYEEAIYYIMQNPGRMVIKADGLADGKGVFLTSSGKDAVDAVEEIMVNDRFGDSGSTIIMEEHLDGQEVSILTFSDGKTFISMPAGQDHKRIGEGDAGLNTRGMGVYAPVPAATPAIMEQIEKDIIAPTFEGLRQEGRPFKGLLFTGVMLTRSGPKVIEYNVRFGDPEAQAIIPLLIPEVDLVDVLFACIEERLHEIKIPVSSISAYSVVIATEGYPQTKPLKGEVVEFKELPKDCLLFHSGTRIVQDKIETSGGRAFTVVGLGPTLPDAVKKAYEGVESISFAGMYYRKDIAHRALTNTEDIDEEKGTNGSKHSERSSSPPHLSPKSVNSGYSNW